MIRITPKAVLNTAYVAIALLGAALIGTSLAGGAPALDVTVFDSAAPTTPINHNNSPPYNFGSTAVGTPLIKTFRVQHTGSSSTTTLTVGENIAVPLGFTLMKVNWSVAAPVAPQVSGSGNASVAQTQFVEFQVALNSATAGPKSGQILIPTNVTGKNPYILNVAGTVTGTTGGPTGPCYRIVDDGNSGFTTTGTWTGGYFETGLEFQRDLTWADPSPGAPNAEATWTFTGLAPGNYRVAATWKGYSWGATNAPYRVYDNGTPVAAAVPVDQTQDPPGTGPNGLVDAATTWQILGTHAINSGTLRVRLSNDCNSWPNADAVRIERVDGYGRIIDDTETASSAFSFTGTWTGGYTETFLDFQSFETWADFVGTSGTPNAKAIWRFTGLTPGTYQVWATWKDYSWGATDAPYQVFNSDGTTPLTPLVRVNQQALPAADLVDAAANWKTIGGPVNISGSSLTVCLTNNCDSWPNADAVRIERCDTGGGGGSGQADIVRFLEQATWGPTDALIAQVQTQGFDAWLNAQFTVAATGYPIALFPEHDPNNNVTNENRISCYGQIFTDPNNPSSTTNPSRTACLRNHYQAYNLQNRFFQNAWHGNDQLRQRVAWALHKIWVISQVDITLPSWVSVYAQILNNRAFGNYRTLMEEITFNPGMGNYLDMAGSTTAQPNENYPRELLQLFTIGLTELNPDGTNRTGNQATYNQAAINEHTKVYTGVGIIQSRYQGNTAIRAFANYVNPMVFGPSRTNAATPAFGDPNRPNWVSNDTINQNAVNHNFGVKYLLRSFTQPARTGTPTTSTTAINNAYLDIRESLDNIYSHPNVAPFISKQLIQSLVTSNPSPGYVARVVDVWNRNKFTTGTTLNPNQLREVVRAILLDPEARGDVKTDPTYGHIKEPVLFANNLFRLANPRNAGGFDYSQNPSPAIPARTINSDYWVNPQVTTMGQDVFRPPSVFSYYSPNRPAPGVSPPLAAGETQIINSQTGIARVNFVNQMANPASGSGTAVQPNNFAGAGGVVNINPPFVPATQQATYPTTYGPSPLSPGRPGLPIEPATYYGTSVDISTWLLPFAQQSDTVQATALIEELNRIMMHGTMTAKMKDEIKNAVLNVPTTNLNRRLRTAFYLVGSSSQYQTQQ
jgi:uncharacterized protein (DUF1800 family)